MGGVNQFTLAQARPTLTQVAGMTGMSLSDPRFLDRINLAQQEILDLGDYPGTVDRWYLVFDEISGELVMPYYLDRLYQITVDRVPSQVMSGWAEFINYGTGPRDDQIFADSAPGFVPTCWQSDCLDRGEVCSRFPIPLVNGPWVIRCYAQVDEEVDGENPVINLQGWNENRIIRTEESGEYVIGVNLEIDNSVPFTVTTQEFERLTHVVKPRTRGYVRIAAWNGSVEVPLSDYAYLETVPSYRNYFIESLYRPTQGVRNRIVRARARRRYVPALQDNDVLVIGNLNALAAMMQSQWKRLAGNPQEAEYYMSVVKRILGEEATAYNGKARTPAISFTRGFPLGAVPFVR